MKWKKIFCEKDFLERFLNEKPEESLPGDPENEKYENWRHLWRMLISSDTTIGCSESFIQNNIDKDLFRKFLKRKTDGYCNLLFSDQAFVHLSSLKSNPSIEELSAVYLTNHGQHDHARKHGVINISMEDIPLCAKYFNDNGDAIAKNEELSWNEFKDQLKHNCNSLIFVDNYGLKSMENNLFVLLNNLLPINLDVVFNITIVSSEFSEQDTIKLKNYLQKNRPYLRYSIQFLKATIKHNDQPKEVNLFHDRAIITNNIWIEIGGGFDIFRRVNGHCEANKTTTIGFVYPFMTGSTKYCNAYNFLIEDVNDAFNKLKQKPNNRILNL